MNSQIKNNFRLKSIIKLLLQSIYIIALCFIGFVQLQKSVYSHSVDDLPLLPEYFLFNMLMLLALFFLFSFPWKKLSTGGLTFSILITVLSVVNFYTLRFHGSILTAAEFANAKTALNVINQYKFFEYSMLKYFWPLPVLFILSVSVSIAENYFIESSKSIFTSNVGKRTRIQKACVFLVLPILIFSFFSTSRVEAYLKSIKGSWNQGAYSKQYGYLLTLYTSITRPELSEPDGYDFSSLRHALPQVTQESTSTPPDIFLILNETFYDLQSITDLETDIDPFASFRDIPGAIYGYSVSRGGGGTNNTEFELLTGIPQFLVNSTPFNVLDMSTMPTISSLLSDQGYYTIGTHSDNAQNYNRIKAYDQIGFDEIYFKPAYTDRELYGNRWALTDRCVYENLVTWYEAAQKNGKPIFTYCLTCQNHGGWTENEPDESIVHVKNYTGSIEENEINEYLSCMKLSSDAFAWLCDYFRKADRPVIVCMIGDHSPSFIGEITTRDFGSREMIEQASTPFVLWANYDLGISQTDIGYISATAVGPLLLKAAGVQYSPFYQYILNLSKEFPVITGWGKYMDSEGNVSTYTDHTPDTKEIWDYFYLSYNNLLSESDNDWFALPPS